LNTPTDLQSFDLTRPDIRLDATFPEPPTAFGDTLTVPHFSERTEPQRPDTQAPSFYATFSAQVPTAPETEARSLRSTFKTLAGEAELTTVNNAFFFLDKVDPNFGKRFADLSAKLNSELDLQQSMTSETAHSLYAEAVDKNNADALRVRSQALTEAASRGFTLPTGALMSSVQQARQAGADNNARSAMNIVYKEAELKLQRTTLAMNIAVDLFKAGTGVLFSFFKSSLDISNLALTVAKDEISLLIQMYDVAAKVFAARLDVYKTEASVYATKVSAAAQMVEMYKAEISAFESTLNADKTKVELYKAQVEALRMYGEVYKTRVDAAVSKASFEKLRLDLFRTDVDAYSAQVSAKATEWQGYQAQLSGRKVEVEVFAAQTQAFLGKLEAFKSQHSARSEKIKAEATVNEGILNELRGKTAAYAELIRANTTLLSGSIEQQKQAGVAYKGQIDAALAGDQLKLEAYKANVAAIVETSRANTAALSAQAEINGGQMSALANVYGELLKIYSGPATAAAAGMVGLASVSVDEGSSPLPL